MLATLPIGCPYPALDLARDAEIVSQDAAAEFCYLVVSGCVRTVRVLTDGRRQIGEFLFPGDLLGWNIEATHDFGAEAVTRVLLYRYHRAHLRTLAKGSARLRSCLEAFTMARLQSGRTHILLLGRMTATERVASFALDMSNRFNCREQGLVEFPMTRTDIADYLGLTAETVSRQLTLLRRTGTIAVARRRSATRDHAKLDDTAAGAAR